MKGITKNVYALVTLVLFAISVLFLVLVVSLYSKSTAVDGTTVGSIYIGDKESREAKKEVLLSDVADWKKDVYYTIQFQNVEMVIGYTDEEMGSDTVAKKDRLTILDFDVEETLDKLTLDTKNLAYFKENTANIELFKERIAYVFGLDAFNNLDFTKLMSDIVKNARNMATIAVFDLGKDGYMLDGFANSVVNSITLQNVTTEAIDAIVEAYPEIEIKPQEDTENKLGFSAVKFFQGTKLSNDKLNIIATGLAAVVQKSSFTVTVKNQDIFIRDYAYNGMTARINVKDGTDLKIINPETTTYYVKTYKVSDTELRFDLVGCKFINTYEVEIIEELVSPLPDKEYNNGLKFGVDGMIIDEEQGIYYYVFDEGSQSKIISYIKVSTNVHGEVTRTNIYLKQEFYQGEAAYWVWNYLPKDYVPAGAGE